MPQDADGSLLISLLWAAWISFNIYWWLDRFSWPGQSDKAHAGPATDNASGTVQETHIPSKTAITSPNLVPIVAEILRRDETDFIEDFLGKRLTDYETIVSAFDAGHRDVFRPLVSSEIYESWSDAIMVRNLQQRSTETVFSRIEPPEIVGGLIDETHMEVCIRFTGDCFRLSGTTTVEQIQEAATRYHNVDVWTFSRTLSGRDSAWRVVATAGE